MHLQRRFFTLIILKTGRCKNYLPLQVACCKNSFFHYLISSVSFPPVLLELGAKRLLCQLGNCSSYVERAGPSGLCAKKPEEGTVAHFILSGVFFIPTRGFLFQKCPVQTYSQN